MNKLRTVAATSLPQSSSSIFYGSFLPTVKPRNDHFPYKVIKTSNASILEASLGSGEKLLLKPGSILASFGGNMPPNTSVKSLSFAESVKRKLAGGSLFLEQFTAENNTTLLVGSATKIGGDITVLPIDVTKEYIYRSDSFLACTNNVQLSIIPTTLGLENGGFFFGLASGALETDSSLPSPDTHSKSILALSKAGSGLLPVYLESNQELLIDPSRLVAWESHMTFKTDSFDTSSSSLIPWRSLPWMTEKGLPFRHAAESILYYTGNAWRLAKSSWNYWVMGRRGLYRFQGPGELILAVE